MSVGVCEVRGALKPVLLTPNLAFAQSDQCSRGALRIDKDPSLLQKMALRGKNWLPEVAISRY